MLNRSGVGCNLKNKKNYLSLLLVAVIVVVDVVVAVDFGLILLTTVAPVPGTSGLSMMGGRSGSALAVSLLVPVRN